jgi:hypothetical protein
LTAIVAQIAPEIRDPDQVLKLRQLQTCLASAEPGRPLVLMMGSSRVAMGYRPELIERRNGPIYFNYGMCYSGPLLDLITLHRLLKAGIHPQHILLEVWPPHLAAESAQQFHAVALNVSRLTWSDLKVLAPYTRKRASLYGDWLVNRLESWSTYRFTLTRLFGPHWLDASPEATPRWSGMRERGWLGQDPYRDHPAPSVYQRYLTHTRYRLARELHSPVMARDGRSALLEFLEVCRREKIQVDLIWMPESPEFRGSYGDEGLEEAAADLQSLARREGVRLIDASEWVPEDGFVDGYHLTHAGAELFTRMLESDVLSPYLARREAGRPLASAFLTQHISAGDRSLARRIGAATSSIR